MGARRTGPDQPLMVVVFVEVAHTPETTEEVVAKFKLNRREWNMAEIVMDAVVCFPDNTRWGITPAL